MFNLNHTFSERRKSFLCFTMLNERLPNFVYIESLNFGGLKKFLKEKVTQSCPTLCNPTDYTVHGILQERIQEWVAFPFSRESSKPRSPALQEDSLSAELPGKKAILQGTEMCFLSFFLKNTAQMILVFIILFLLIYTFTLRLC